jgi:hypothetical protein
MRYKLLWAQARLRQGRIALMFAGYLIAASLAIVLAAGGVGAAFASILVGQAEPVARVVLGGAFLNMLVTSVLLGFGMNKVFAETSLRRYPLTVWEQLAARQFIGVLEPLWLLAAALNLGVAAGYAARGLVTPWTGAAAALLLALLNYLLARVLQTLLERLMAARGGAFLAPVLIWTAAVGATLLLPALSRSAAARGILFGALEATPPFAAAAILSGQGLALPAIVLALWLLALSAVLLRLDRLEPPSRAAGGAEAAWSGPVDRLAALLPGVDRPLFARSLRYYLRANKVRFTALLTVPMLGFILFMAADSQSRSSSADPDALFVAAFFASFAVGVISTTHMDNNVFGYERSGFRRFLLAPAPPLAVLRSVTAASLAVGACQIPVAAAAWTLFSPYSGQGRMLAVLVANAFTGMFLCRCLAMWASLLAPRRANYFENFGNQLSAGGNVVAMGSVLLPMLLPQLLRSSVLSPVLLRYWWAALLAAPLAALLLHLTLRAGARTFTSRRERLLAVIEGRS